MADRDDPLLVKYLQAQIGAAGAAFCEYAGGELYRRLNETARREGCSPAECEEISRNAVKRCIQSLVGGIEHARTARQFRRGN